MNYFLIFVFLSLISMMPYPSAAQEWDRPLYFPDYYFYAERRLMNHTIKTMSVKSLDDCEYLCYLEDACVSLNIKNKDPGGTHECELNNSTHMEHDRDLVYSPIYYYRGAKNNCGKSGQLCENNATCQSGFTDKGYRCSCTAVFEGEHCEKDIDECYRGTHKCHVNATCNNTKGSYNCSCKEGYSGNGYNCRDIDECDRGTHKCHVNATCINTKGSYNCSCKEGYTGDGHNCTDIDECAKATPVCDVNAVCNNTRGSYNCTCKPGYNGDGHNCTDIDECASNPCQHNGSCSDVVNGYTCSCIAGFTGKNCETDIDDCFSNPCQHQGNCIDGVNGYTCNCLAGYIGTHCETVDICQNYQTLSDAERKESYSSTSGFQCDNTLNGWYRFEGAAGTKIATTCPHMKHCGANFPGWLKGAHPTAVEGIVRRQVCFNKGGCCKQSVSIRVKKCGSYFIYELNPPGGCSRRYCGSE